MLALNDQAFDKTVPKGEFCCTIVVELNSIVDSNIHFIEIISVLFQRYKICIWNIRLLSYFFKYANIK